MEDENGNRIQDLLHQILSLEFIIHTLKQKNKELRERLADYEPAEEQWQVSDYEDES